MKSIRDRVQELGDQAFTPTKPDADPAWVRAAYNTEDARQYLAQRNELLTALQGIAERLTRAVQDGDTTRVVRALEVARDAIKQAERR